MVLIIVFSDVGIADTQVLHENFQRRRLFAGCWTNTKLSGNAITNFSNGSVVRRPSGRSFLSPP